MINVYDIEVPSNITLNKGKNEFIDLHGSIVWPNSQKKVFKFEWSWKDEGPPLFLTSNLIYLHSDWVVDTDQYTVRASSSDSINQTVILPPFATSKIIIDKLFFIIKELQKFVDNLFEFCTNNETIAPLFNAIKTHYVITLSPKIVITENYLKTVLFKNEHFSYMSLRMLLIFTPINGKQLNTLETKMCSSIIKTIHNRLGIYLGKDALDNELKQKSSTSTIEVKHFFAVP